MEHCDFAAIEALLRRHGFHFSKSMGQNFLIDASVPAAIAEASEAGEGNGVLEIGPGIGALYAIRGGSKKIRSVMFLVLGLLFVKMLYELLF